MPPSILDGDLEALYMACPLAAARELAGHLPPGPVLELCCGVGGITRALAGEHAVLAVDQDLARIMVNQANLAAMGLAGAVDYLCCDLTRPALLAERSFAVCVLDPDWSRAGDAPQNWSTDPAEMRPPAGALLRLALACSPRAVLRLPSVMAGAGVGGLEPVRRLPYPTKERLKFEFGFFGDWPPDVGRA